MSKFKIKVTLDSFTRTLEVDRGSLLQLNVLKPKIESLFSDSNNKAGNLDLRYSTSDGRVQPIYQDFHMVDAVKEAEKSGSKYITLVAKRETGTASSYTTSSSSSTQSPSRSGSFNYGSRSPSFTGMSTSGSPAATSTGRERSVSSSRLSMGLSSTPKFCEECGASLTANARFCSGCGSPTPSAPTSSSSGGSGSRPSSRSGSFNYGSPSTGASNPNPPSVGGSSGDQVCYSCKRAISGTGIRALDKVWHRECFACKSCHKSLLDTNFVSDNGLPMCPQCYDELFGKRCFKCQELIEGSYLNVEGKEYHKQCFVCSSCSKPFQSGGYFMKHGQAVCKDCV